MSVRRRPTSTSFRRKSSSGRKQEHSSTSPTKVLVQRNQVVVPVRAWVEAEQDFLGNPSVSLACSDVYSVARVYRGCWYRFEQNSVYISALSCLRLHSNVEKLSMSKRSYEKIRYWRLNYVSEAQLMYNNSNNKKLSSPSLFLWSRLSLCWLKRSRLQKGKKMKRIFNDFNEKCAAVWQNALTSPGRDK